MVPDPDLNGPHQIRIEILTTIQSKITSRDVIQCGSIRFWIPLAPEGSGSDFIQMIMVKISKDFLDSDRVA